MAIPTVGMPPGPVKPSCERIWRPGDVGSRGSMGQGTVAIVVHGGAWSIPPGAREPHTRGCLAAAERGFAILDSGGSAVDAVVAALESFR